MLQKQRPVPFEFQAVQPLDVGGWIEISRLSSYGGYFGEPTGVCMPGGNNLHTLDSDQQHSQRDAHASNEDEKTHEWTAGCRVRRNSFSCSDERSRAGRADALSSGCGKQREDAWSSDLYKELLRAQDAIADAAAMMSMSPHLYSAKADLGYVTEILRKVRCEIDQANSSYSSTVNENNEAQTVRLGRSMRSQSMGSAEGIYCDDAVSSTSGSSSNMPVVLANFFDRAGEVRILQERIAELSFAMSGRNMAGTSSVTPGDQRDRQHRHDEAKLASLQTSLNSAKEAAAEQRAMCLARGIDPEAFRYRRSSSSSA